MATIRSILVPASYAVAVLVLLGIAVAILQPMWQGKGFDPATSFRAGARLAIDSSSGKAAIRAVAGGVGKPISVTGTASSATDSWVAIYLPFDKAQISAGGVLDAKVTLDVVTASTATVCVGIFDGKNDHCSSAQPISASRSMEIHSAIIDAGKAHVKINIFPKSPNEKIDFSVRVVSIDAAK